MGAEGIERTSETRDRMAKDPHLQPVRRFKPLAEHRNPLPDGSRTGEDDGDDEQSNGQPDGALEKLRLHPHTKRTGRDDNHDRERR